MSQVIRFGIPSFDTLFARPEGANRSGLFLPHDKGDCSETITFCIAGVDGTGKSVLAMHLASTYLGDGLVDTAYRTMTSGYCGRSPGVVYVTTDLSRERAETVWNNFHLYGPGLRDYSPFPAERKSEPYIIFTDRFDLKVYAPLDGSNPESDPNPFKPRSIALVDLAATSTGDDWGFINRLLATHPPLEKGQRRDLLIIDAVEGLETYVGDKDQFGESRTRRSRIAQLLRAARGKCHVAFVVEEPQDGSKLPEDFVADVVIRLRYRGDRDYSRRTIEIEKARGQAHARGQHEIVIRGGAGTTTGEGQNPDDPRVGPEEVPQSYFYVFQSVHYLNREIMRRGAPEDAKNKSLQLAGFGIPYLDNMLTPTWKKLPNHSGATVEEVRGTKGYGLPSDAPTALIGEDATYKSRLGRAFLAQCFADKNPQHGADPKNPDEMGVAILLTTRDIERDELLDRFACHLDWEDQTTKQMKENEAVLDRIICRRLEVHHVSPSVLIHIVKRAVEKAQETIFGRIPSDLAERRGRGHRIRLVIDNWTAVQRAYPEVRNDPLFLPFLLFYLRREGICSLIIATDSGGPRRAGTNGSPVATLRELTQHQIHTWHVPFFGTNRVAITVVPPQGGEHLAIIRELRLMRLKECRHKLARTLTGQPTIDDRKRHVEFEREFQELREHVIVDPRFELFRGLEEGKPSLVPFRTHLFAETDACLAYHREMNELFSRLVSGETGQQIIFSENPTDYERLREFGQLVRGARLDHTLVFQVDEFWAESDQEGNLRDQREYLFNKTVEDPGGDLETFFSAEEDPFRVLQRSKADHANEAQYRYQFLDREGDYLEYLRHGWHLNKVPFFWDFGFLLCHKQAWEDALADMPAHDWIWAALSSPRSVDCTWRQFFGACRSVAAHLSARQSSRVFPFDVSLIATESFSCLALEIWASELFCKVHFEEFRYTRPKPEQGLIELLSKTDEEGYRALFRVFLLLGAVFSPEQFTSDSLVFSSRPANPSAIAARHWYSTACAFCASKPKEEMWVPLRLPGRFSVRGDWFLAVAKGSLSPRLGERTIDLLNTRRGNIVRLQSGVGLPIRDTSQSDAAELWTPLHSARSSKQRMTYDDLLKLGASKASADANEFFWLWRSQLHYYDRHARVWQRWLCDMLIKWFANNSSDDALANYDAVVLDSRELPYYKEFKNYCEELVNTLRRATSA